MDQQTLLQKLFIIFNNSAKAYENYLMGGKTFQLANDLKLQNMAALELLQENKSAIQAHLYPEIDSLITHYTAWKTKWEKLAAEINPGPADEFIFVNENRFPREAVKKLEAAVSG